MYPEQEQNQVAEIAKQQARKALRKKGIALLKKAGKAAARAAVHATAAVLKSLLGFLASIGLPYILIIVGSLLLLFMIYLGTTMLFSSGEGLSKDAKERHSYVIEQSNQTVDMSKLEQIPYRVPPELIISALQVYDSTKHGKSEKEAIKTMAQALKPIFEYGEYEGSIETEVETCIDGKCTTEKSEDKFTITPLVHVEAWDRVMTANYTPHSTGWEISVTQSTTTKEVPKKDAEGKPTGEMMTVEVPKVVTIKNRAHTFRADENETMDYTYFDRVLSSPPFDYGPKDKLMVEALYQATGGDISYSEWVTGSSFGGGFNGTVTPGAGIPPEYMQYYLAAEKIYKVDWYYLAAFHSVETQFSTHPTMISSVGAEGHLQFMPCTWIGWSYPACKGSNGGVKIPDYIKYDPSMIKRFGGYGVDANKNGVASPWEIEDAIYTAAAYLSANGFSSNIDRAIYAYNHADWYVQKIKGNAISFRDAAVYAPNSGEVPALKPGDFMRPSMGSITSPFGYRSLGGGAFHGGVDLSTGKNDTPVVATADGTITRVVSNCPPIGYFGSKCGGGFGNHVYVKHVVGGVTYEAVYGHFTKTAPLQVGQAVTQGQFLGLMGTSGSSTGIHLHFELHKGKKVGKTNALNPALYVPL